MDLHRGCGELVRPAWRWWFPRRGFAPVRHQRDEPCI